MAGVAPWFVQEGGYTLHSDPQQIFAMFSRFGSTSGFVSDEELLHARETYRPTAVVPSDEMAFAHWTERVCANSDTVVSRELAGLTDEQLARLAAEFEKAPRRPRTDRLRFAFPLAVGFGTLALACALVEAMTPGKAVGLTPWVAACLTTGTLATLALAGGVLANMRLVPFEMAYGKLGLLVGALNEQHPWLYKTFLLQRHSAAAAYRATVLTERGCLRGVDYVMMREVADRHDALELTRTARDVTSAVQKLG